LGTTDPEGSVTVPTTVAVWADAKNDKPTNSEQSINRERMRPYFSANKILPACPYAKDIIVSTPSRLLPELVNELPGNVNDAGQLVPVFVDDCQENF
jgi:hypothetical protein